MEIDESALLSRGLSLQQVPPPCALQTSKLPRARLRRRHRHAGGTGGGLRLHGTHPAGHRQYLQQRQRHSYCRPGARLQRRGDTSSRHGHGQGRPAILIGAIMEPGGQVDVWSRDFMPWWRTFGARRRPACKLEITYEQSDYASAAPAGGSQEPGYRYRPGAAGTVVYPGLARRSGSCDYPAAVWPDLHHRYGTHGYGAAADVSQRADRCAGTAGGRLHRHDRRSTQTAAAGTTRPWRRLAAP